MRRSQLAAIGSLLGDDTRAELLTALMDGRAHTGGELARHAGVSASTASEHLSRLLDSGMVAVEAQGRHRYFRLAGAHIAELLETVGAASTPPQPHGGRRAADLTYARSCYDHLAGELAVRIFDQLCRGGHIGGDAHHLHVTTSGFALLERLGVDSDALRAARRPMARACLDWTERRHHLAGAAGAALFTALRATGWVRHGARPRSVVVTAAGRDGLARHFPQAG